MNTKINLWQYYGIWFKLINEDSYYECSVIRNGVILGSFRDNSPITAEMLARDFSYKYVDSLKTKKPL
jgi:hypothetical protein